MFTFFNTCHQCICRDCNGNIHVNGGGSGSNGFNCWSGCNGRNGGSFNESATGLVNEELERGFGVTSGGTNSSTNSNYGCARVCGCNWSCHSFCGSSGCWRNRCGRSYVGYND